MTGSTCPRCAREAPEAARYCVGCGAPLRLRDDATPARLDRPLDLDRRQGRPGGAGLAPREAAPPGDGIGEAERSRWDLGASPARAAEPFLDGAVLGAGPVAAEPEPAAAEPLPDPDVDALEIHVQRPPSWRRAAAWTVDAAPFLAAGVAGGRSFLRAAAPAPGGDVTALLDLAAREQGIVLSLSAAVAIALAAYATLAHLLAGATLGKWLLGLRVVGPDGARPSPARSAARSALAIVSAALLGLGFLLALFTRSGRALHDLVARTWVVKAP